MLDFSRTSKPQAATSTVWRASLIGTRSLLNSGNKGTLKVGG